MLCFYSGYFDSCFNGGFAEAARQAVDLEEEDTDTFSHFVNWLYTRQLPPETRTADQYKDIASLWFFADRRQIPLLMNACVDGFRDAIVRLWTFPFLSLGMVYDNTTASAGLRRLVINLLVSMGNATLCLEEKRRGQYPIEALWDIAELTWGAGAKTRSSKEDIANWDLCKYHSHEEGVSCTNFMKKRKREDSGAEN